ncbi:MAG: OB-fold domain-containing protein [Actinomycetota bacterium]|nr:OB-fold domain-containing protein [Actinomycetota bacterium]
MPVRLRPFLDDDNRAFWTGSGDGSLHLHRCHLCGWWTHPAAPRCRRCLSAEVSPQAVSGRGTVATFTVNHQPWIPGSEPYIVALVELVEQTGLYLTTNLVGIDGDDVTFGMPVRVVFEVVDDIYYPLFEAAPST